MWTCQKCNRKFKVNNQSHMCTSTTIDDLFLNKPQEVILAFDDIITIITEWQPNYIGTSTKSIVCTNKKAWLIIKPMSKALDLKFYLDQELNSNVFHKVHFMMNKFAHHIRISSSEEITAEMIDYLKIGYDFANKD